MADMVTKAKAHGVSAVAEISEAELAVRMCEANYGIRRPTGSTAEQALDNMEPEVRRAWRRSANAAMSYWRECIENMQQAN